MRLEEYINNFYEADARDTVVSQVLKAKIVKQAMDTPAGKALLNSVIDRLRDKVMALVAGCSKGELDEQLNSIHKSALEVHIIYNLLKDWAQIVADGEKHEAAMKEK